MVLNISCIANMAFEDGLEAVKMKQTGIAEVSNVKSDILYPISAQYWAPMHVYYSHLHH